MTELLSQPLPIAIAALVVALVAVAAAVVMVRRAAGRTAVVERRLNALYAEIEHAVGHQLDRSGASGWRDQLAAELGRLAVASGSAVRGEPTSDWVATALRALDTAERCLPTEDEAARTTTALGLAGRLSESRQALGTVTGSSELEDALVSGALNDVLTTAPLMSAYFGHDAPLVPVVEAYLVAAAALRLALAEAGVIVDTPSVLSIVSGREARGDTFDVRELRRIPQAKAVAGRVADRLGPGENLIVYCNTPGWVKRDGRRAPALVFWNHASWLA